MTDTQHVPWPGGGPDPSEASAAPAPAAVEDPSPGISRRIISGIRQNKALPIDHIHVACYNFIATHELKCGGSFIHADKKSWLFNGLDSRVYEIDIKNRAFTSYLALKYGLLKTEAITQHIVAALDAFTQAKGEQREVRRFTFFDRETQTLYVSRYNGTCYRLDGNSVDIVPNGSGALFVDDDGGVPVQADIAPHGILLDRLVNDLQYVHATESGTPPEVQKRLLTLWLFAVGMPDLFPTKPLLLITGEKGSGKSTAIQRVQIVVHGKDSTQSVSQKGEEDFGVTLLRTPIALLDNVDKVVDWLPDALCAYATGGGWMRRKKYTDADIIEVRPQAFIALATKNPATFRRDDVADRTLVIRLERRSADGGFLALDTIRQELFRDRDKLFGEWLYYLNAIIAEIRKGTAPVRSSHRMADFAATSAVIGRAIGLDEAAVDSALTAAQDERDSMSLEGDILLDVLDKWLETTTNQNREITAAVLHHELSTIATDAGRKNFYKNARTLAQRIREAESGLGRHFHVRKRDGANGTQLYQFSWAK